MLRAFWARCPGDLMRQTGLAQVFEDAVFPSLLYLPSLTPVDESVAILSAAYPTLMVLAGVDLDMAAADGNPTNGFTQEQQKLLDRIIREGILVGYNHASEHVRIVELLCEQLRCIVNGMGILTIKHLKVRQVSSQTSCSATPLFLQNRKKKKKTKALMQTNYKVRRKHAMLTLFHS